MEEVLYTTFGRRCLLCFTLDQYPLQITKMDSVLVGLSVVTHTTRVCACIERFRVEYQRRTSWFVVSSVC